MKQIFYCYIIFNFCFACNNSENNKNSQKQTKLQNMANELIGIWMSDTTDSTTISSIGNATMTFAKDGQLLYNIDAGDAIQKINLIYKINGDTIISDQPTHPQEQKSKFRIENGNKLFLECEGETTVFMRKTE